MATTKKPTSENMTTGRVIAAGLVRYSLRVAPCAQ